MLNQMSQQQQEDYLNDFIDSLIVECKPAPPTSMDQDFASMLESIRGVKRLRSDKELLADLMAGDEANITGKNVVTGTSRASWRKLWISGAAIAATLFLAVGIFSQINRMNPAMDAAEEAPAMLRSAEIVEDSEAPAEAAPKSALSEETPRIAASEAAPETLADELPGVMEAMEAPVASEDTAGEESIALFGIQEELPSMGVAIVVKEIDTSYVELNLIDVPVHYQAFRLSEDLKYAVNENSIEQGSLYTITFEVEEGEVPLLTRMEPIDEAVLEASYLGRADSNFAEFLINGKVQVIALSEETKSVAAALEADVDSEGVLAVITIEGSNFSTSGIVTRIDKISD